MFPLPFDRVIIYDDSGGENNMSLAEFLGRPLDEKIGYILSRRIDFFKGAVPVDRKLALAALRRHQAAR